ncbi:hypothetical protein IV203_005306 [Nitzschia inconspicua]|uniref:DUF2237 domain-containing protein n=1 Tax=Nitzschia inconspicua TaxID=303405 RepID=A0A9K3KM31_9STRA|nr:hypothetical protein IV203_005306 [Nitzschia inconspicua]
MVRQTPLLLLFLQIGCCNAFTALDQRWRIASNLPRSTRRRASKENENNEEVSDVNVLGTALRSCCKDVRNTGVGTGFYRNGYCCTGEQDLGRHTVCCQVTNDFLDFSKSVGNDLSTPAPQYMFPGLKEGDIWCLCAQRWAQAYQAGKAPKIFLQATHEKTLDYATFEILREFAIDQEEADKRLDQLNQDREKLKKLL